MDTDEINVSSTRGISFVVSEAAKRLETNRRVTLCGINFAMPRLVQAVELLKHSIKGLHQVNTFERVSDSNKTRLTVTLSLTELDTRAKGYQAPLSLSKVTERPLSEISKVPERRPRPERKPETEGRVGEEETKTGRPFQRRGRRGGRGGRARGSQGPRTAGGPTSTGPRGGQGRPQRKPSGPRGTGGVGADKYTRVPRRIEEEKLEDNEFRVTAKLSVDASVNKAVVQFRRNGSSSVILKATGSAIPQAVAIAEAIRRGVSGLHQLTQVSRLEVVDVFKPKEEGLSEISKTRQVPTIEIVLSKTTLDKNHYGYQAPLAADKVKEISLEEAEKSS
mmetsp:Transcript_5240/g.9620  ORF Transcript_5240/g.9620 Transcript_5240/m.9620 type:complete len:335 (+) Transcript_5240:43-1047(+)